MILNMIQESEKHSKQKSNADIKYNSVQQTNAIPIQFTGINACQPPSKRKEKFNSEEKSAQT